MLRRLTPTSPVSMLLLRKPVLISGSVAAMRLSWSPLNEIATTWSFTPAASSSCLSSGTMPAVVLLSSMKWLTLRPLRAAKNSCSVGTV
ncbi:hypothetical protein D3C80_1954160 [compost metagenome]